MQTLTDDLAAESDALRALVSGLDEPGWRLDTPAAGWSIADQVSHLAYYDDAAMLSVTDPETFGREVEAAGGTDPDRVALMYRSMPGAELLDWFNTARDRLLHTFRGLDPSTRVPWFGPAMSAASSLTARIMETWAHAQDVADTLDVSPAPSSRLRHVAHIGIGARAYSLAVNDLPSSDVPIRVELLAPDGETWTWGPQAAPDRVIGDALDFCLAVTQRRHLDDLGLTVVGPHAQQWMTIAQAFAGGRGPGRPPGQFSRT